MANCPEVVVTYHALWRAGAVITPVVFLVTAPELRHIIADSGAVAVVTTAELAPKVAAAGVDGLPVFVVGENFAELEAAEPESDHRPCRRRPRGAALHRRHDRPQQGRRAEPRQPVPRRRVVALRSVTSPGLVRGITALPLSHSFGLLVTVGGLHTPEPPVSILQRWFEPTEWLRLAAEHRAQTTAVVPSMLAILLGQPLEDYDLSALRFVFSGAAPLSAAVARRVRAARSVGHGPGRLWVYGDRRHHLQLAAAGTASRARSAGRCRASTVRIVGPDGRDLPPGEDGEIVVSGANVMTHYWGGDAAAGRLVRHRRRRPRWTPTVT